MSHIVHSIRRISPRFDDNSRACREIKRLYQSLDLFIGETSSFNSFHVISVDVRMLPFNMLLLDNFVSVKIDDKLKKVIPFGFGFDGSLHPSMASWRMV